MANTKVVIKVAAPASKELYLVGNTTALGAWNPSKAVKLEYCTECGKYTVTKMLPADETVEFKVLAAKSFDAVEKGANGEELQNHSFVVSKGLTVEVEVLNFAN